MSILMIPFLLLGPGLIIASFLVKRVSVRVILTFLGIVVIVWCTYIFATIPMMYEQEHRTVENQYHQQIITELDVMLEGGQSKEAKILTAQYLDKTRGSSFMRNPLHDIVQSIETKKTEQTVGGDAK